MQNFLLNIHKTIKHRFKSREEEGLSQFRDQGKVQGGRSEGQVGEKCVVEMFLSRTLPPSPVTQRSDPVGSLELNDVDYC